MSRRSVRSVGLVASLLGLKLTACGSPPPPEPPTPPPAETTAVAATPPPPPAPAAPAEPSPEEKKKAAAKKQLEADRAAWDASHKTEVARWTPEVRAAATALAAKTFPTGKAAVQAALASKHRNPKNAERDAARHPVETLELFGFKPNMTVLDIGPGEGWWTEILAPVLAKSGKYMATSGDPNGPPDARSTFYAQRWKSFLETSPEAFGKVETVVVDGTKPSLGMENKLDLVLVMRGVHNWHATKTLDTWLTEIHKALKPGGVLGIEEHRAKADANPDESAKNGYLPEAFVIERAKAAGFELGAKAEVNANPKDTKDYPDGVWTLPPVLRNGDKDREKYAAIGESDRMTLKLVKPKAGAKPAGAPAKAAPAKP